MAGNATQPLRVGFIGAGANTRLRHLPGFAAIEGVQLVAVCNRSLESGHRVADQFGVDRVTDDPEAIFAADDIDAVCIGTWPYRHREFVVRALEAGKHVLCEARMAMDASEAREMLAASRKHPEVVAQLVPAPFDLKSWRTIRRLLAEGALGEVHEVHVTALNGNTLADAPLHWRDQARYSGHNTMVLGILSETVQRWLGATERVLADAAIYVPSRIDDESGDRVAIDIPDSLGVLARMTNGARAVYRLSTVAANSPDAGSITVYGSAATLHWRMDDSMFFAPVSGRPEPLAPDPGTAGDWNVEVDFVRSIREGAPVELTNFDDGLAYMQFTDAVWRSWHTGSAVALAEV